MAGKYLTMSILPLTAPSVTGEDGCMGSQSAAQDGTVAPVAAIAPQGADRPAGQDHRRRWSRRARMLPGGLGAWAALLVVWLVWGSTYIAIRVADESLPPLAMAGARYLIAGTLLFPIARRSGGPQLRLAMGKSRVPAMRYRAPAMASGGRLSSAT